MTEFPQSLLDGYKQFKTGSFQQTRERYEKLAKEGQAPETMVIACCDSRATPETIFNTLPGELFISRNVANLVPAYNSEVKGHSLPAALEFALLGLKVKRILVLGHKSCGGIKAALAPDFKPLTEGNFVGEWMKPIRSLADKVINDTNLSEAERQTALEHLSVRHSVSNLLTFPHISDLHSKGQVTLHGAWFDISNGELWTMDDESGDFSPIKVS